MNRLKNTFQLMLIVAAGVASFSVAMQWRREDSHDTSTLVDVVVRANPMPFAPASAPRSDMFAPPDRTHVVPQSSGDAFGKLSWVPPPPVVRPLQPSLPPPPVVPVAPALPFTFVGLMEQGTGKPQAFLSKGNALLVVAAGDVIDDNTYRVDSISPQQISITYLPLNTPQILTILGTSK